MFVYIYITHKNPREAIFALRLDPKLFALTYRDLQLEELLQLLLTIN